MDIESLKGALELAGRGIGLWKQAKDLIPQGPERIAAEKAIEEAELALKTAEAKAAQAMGYELCRCTWPPQICLRKDGKDHICPKCGYHAWIAGSESDGF